MSLNKNWKRLKQIWKEKENFVLKSSKREKKYFFRKYAKNLNQKQNTYLATEEKIKFWRLKT